MGGLCYSTCMARQIYWPILRPNCLGIEDHPLWSRILNDEASLDKYLAYVKEYAALTRGMLDGLREYGRAIQDFVVEDPLFEADYDYEESELGTNPYNDKGEYVNSKQMPLLKTLKARLDQVDAQLEAIEAGTLPRNGKYEKGEVCPDWRDDSARDYIPGSQLNDVPVAFCKQCKEAAECFDNGPGTCSAGGELVIEECKPAAACAPCFPYSRCGSDEDRSASVADEVACNLGCQLAGVCFDHKMGFCDLDGHILLEECREVETFCGGCFPNSRCGIEAPATEAPTPAPTPDPTKENEDGEKGGDQSSSAAPCIRSRDVAFMLASFLVSLLLSCA